MNKQTQPINDQDSEEQKQNEQGEIHDVHDEIVSLQSQVEDYKQKYLRALADYQNLEKRVFSEKEEIRKYAAEVTLRKFLPALDNLERALKHIEDKGLQLAIKEFDTALLSSGVKRIEVVGKPFDPFTMECIEVVEGEDGIVLEELTAGYVFYEKVLRVAQVKVGKKI
jgi:molecular chaperone GrpE